MAPRIRASAPPRTSKVHAGKMADFKKLCEQMVQKTGEEPGARSCGFAFDGDEAFARESYKDADAWLARYPGCVCDARRSISMRCWSASVVSAMSVPPSTRRMPASR